MSTNAASQRYARALLEALTQPRDIENARTHLNDLVALCDTHRELHNALTNPAIETNERESVLVEVLDRLETQDTVRRFCLVLFRRRRFDLLGEVAEAFYTLADAKLGRIRARVTVAAPLDGSQQQRLEERLAGYVGRAVEPTYTHDPEILGGVVVQLNGTVLDGSLRSQLDRLRHTLLEEEN